MANCCNLSSTAVPVPSVMACPVCGSHSKQVDTLTVRSLVWHLPFGMALAQYYFCEAPACDVVYFPSNPQTPTFHRDNLLVPVGVKEKQDPISVCYCFGVTRQDIADEVERTGKSTIGERIRAEVKAGNCACEVKNPSGKCCLGDVIRAVHDGRRTADVGNRNGEAPSERRAVCENSPQQEGPEPVQIFPGPV